MKLRLPRPDLRRVARSRSLPWALAVAATAAAVAFLVLWRSERAEDDRRSAVRATTEGFLVALTNFSADTIERDVSEIRSFAVGQFAEEVSETFDADRLEAIREGDVTSTGEVRSVYVQSLDGAAATAFGVVDGTTVNRASGQPRVDVLHVEVGLIETTEGWRVNEVEILQNPQPLPG